MSKITDRLKGQTIILGITGSIAAYKAADLTSRLTESGANVFPVMTESACKFITPLTLKTMAQNPVSTDLWAEESDWQPGHIELADRADLLLVAPASAQCLANFAHGFASDLLGSIHLAMEGPTMLAPAMNGKMLKHPATVANIDVLKQRGYHFVEPEAGRLACGYEGNGKLANVERILDTVCALIASK